MNEEENDESDTDEETVSVTSSSQVLAGKVRPQKWNRDRETYRESAGVPPEDLKDPSGEGVVRDGRRGP